MNQSSGRRREYRRTFLSRIDVSVAAAVGRFCSSANRCVDNQERSDGHQQARQKWPSSKVERMLGDFTRGVRSAFFAASHTVPKRSDASAAASARAVLQPWPMEGLGECAALAHEDSQPVGVMVLAALDPQPERISLVRNRFVGNKRGRNCHQRWHKEQKEILK
jgi:hypothetical protein